MYEKIDTLPYRTFLKLKLKFPVKTIVIRDRDFAIAGTHLMFSGHREYVEHKFRQEGIKVTRHAHDYKSLDTRTPLMGLVYMANDSVVDPAIEVHCLIGHNAQYADAADVATALKKT